MDTKKATMNEMYEAVLEFLTEAEAPEALVDFVNSRLIQGQKAAETAKASRIKKNGGEKKDVTQADFYVGLREKVYAVLTIAEQTGDELLAQIENVTPNGKVYLAAQVAVALKPYVIDGTVLVGKKKVSFIDKNGLARETLRTSYALA